MVPNELRNAAEVRIAVAYFSPDEQILTVLRNIPQLTLIISEEFTINNPYKLEKLPSTTNVLSVPPYSESGKLHAKVLIVKRRNGSLWTLVGSANLTWQGLFSNQEACVALESQNEADRPSLRSIIDWFDSLKANLKPPNLDAAKQVFDTRSSYRLEQRPMSKKTLEETTCYWALKSTSGSGGHQHWPSFVAESVIAIGWEKNKCGSIQRFEGTAQQCHRSSISR
jgi:phosphatidylserine/phosphatidylglycerophosphate/cardiolipin synthase-like enzyme